MRWQVNLHLLFSNILQEIKHKNENFLKFVKNTQSNY